MCNVVKGHFCVIFVHPLCFLSLILILQPKLNCSLQNLWDKERLCVRACVCAPVCGCVRPGVCVCRVNAAFSSPWMRNWFACFVLHFEFWILGKWHICFYYFNTVFENPTVFLFTRLACVTLLLVTKCSVRFSMRRRNNFKNWKAKAKSCQSHRRVNF